METANLLPLRHMSRLIGVPNTWLRAEAEAGRVPHLRAGDQLLFNPQAVIRVLTQRAESEGLRDPSQLVEVAHA